jgi:integrase
MGFDVSFDRGSERLADWAVYVWETYYEHRLAAATKAAYRVIWNRHVLPRLGAMRLREISPREIAALRAELHRRGVGDPTITRALSILQGMLKYAVVEGRISVNPASVVEKPRQRTDGWPEPLDPIVVERICGLLEPRDQLIVALMAYAGLRPQELCALRWEHVRSGKLRVFAPKTRRERYVQVLAPLAADLDAWQKRTGLDFGPVVTTRRGRQADGERGLA